jgi:hypothetical protein
MATSRFDPGAIGTPANVYAPREVARASRAYQTGEAAREQALGPATELMLDLAGVCAGSLVLDVGAPADDRASARAPPRGRTGPPGHVRARQARRL